MAQLARLLDACPLVANAAERDLLFSNPGINQRVQFSSTGEIQRYDGIVWRLLAQGGFSVTAYGAVGDGTADDTAAFTAAMTAAAATIGETVGASVLLPKGEYRVSSQLVIPNKVYLVGQGSRASIIKASDTFPTSTAVVRLGPSTSLAFDCRLVNLQVHCNDLAGSIGIYSTSAQEMSGAYQCLVTRYRDTGILFDKIDTSVFSSNVVVEDCEVYPSGSGSNYGVYFKDVAGAAHCTRTTVNGSIGGSHTSGFRVANSTDGYFHGCHAEHSTNGIQFLNTAAGAVVGLTGASTVTNLVNIDSSASSQIALVAIKGDGSTNTIVDGINGVTMTTDQPFYSPIGRSRQTIDGWYQENVSASQTDVALTRLATTTDNPTNWVALRAGSVTGIAIHSNAARTVGTITAKVFKNGSALGSLTAVIDGTNTTFKATTQARDTSTFAAGDTLSVRITTSSDWAPTTADIRGVLEVEV